MNPRNSSTSSSSRSELLRGCLKIAGWTAAWLVFIDIAIGLMFPYPDDPKNTNPPKIALYFDYGRSIEGKLRRMTRCDGNEASGISKEGWYDPLDIRQLLPPETGPTVSFYGMSHTVQLGETFARLNKGYAVRIIGAPGATPNWSAGAFDRDAYKSDFAMLGIMSIGVPNLTSASPMFWSYEGPMPYTADRYVEENGIEKVIKPTFDTFKAYCQVLNDPERWNDAVAEMTKGDNTYDPWVFKQDIFDHSSLARLFRRAYGQNRFKKLAAASLNKKGFVESSLEIQTARLIVKHFAKAARARGITPVIFVANNFGYSDFLFQALKPTLAEGNIPYLNSADVLSPYDPRGYLPDNHYTMDSNDRLARALSKILQELPRK